MNKRTKASLQAFQRIQQRNGGYHISPYSIQEQAIREHISRGFGDGLQRMVGLLDQKNKI